MAFFFCRGGIPHCLVQGIVFLFFASVSESPLMTPDPWICTSHSTSIQLLLSSPGKIESVTEKSREKSGEQEAKNEAKGNVSRELLPTRWSASLRATWSR